MLKQKTVTRRNSFLYFLGLMLGLFMSSCANKATKKINLDQQQDHSVSILHSSENGPHPDHAFLLGKWQGEVMTNSSDPTGGGKPTLGETGTEVHINLFENGPAIEGTLDIGQVQEQWQFVKEQHIWSDKNIKVHTQEIPQQQLPNWIKARIMNYKYSHLAIFKYLSCHKLDSKQACIIKKDLPEGIVDNGVWVFMVQGEHLFVNVYYTYPSGGQRILEQKLSKR